VVTLKKYARISFGILLVIIGIIGGFVPILQGWMFLIPGLVILADYYPPIHRLVEWAKAKAAKAGINIPGTKSSEKPPEPPA
jgi:uncharacterized membrane protein YbaN (DUF454 family)